MLKLLSLFTDTVHQISDEAFDSIRQAYNLDSLLQVVKTQAETQDDKEPLWFGFILFLLAILVPLGYILIGPTRSWSNGKFPIQLKYKTKNLFEAYICLGIIVIKKDDGDKKEKVKFLAAFLKSKFSGLENNNYNHIIETFKLDVSEESVLLWLKKKMPQDQRIQIIDFLVSLIFYNDELTHAEQNMLYRVAKELSVPRNEVDSILSIRLKRREEQRKQHSTSSYQKVSLKSSCFKILGLDESASLEEIKKAYRSLAKKIHPDLFSNMGEAEKTMAHERFTEINNAYEYLDKAMG